MDPMMQFLKCTDSHHISWVEYRRNVYYMDVQRFVRVPIKSLWRKEALIIHNLKLKKKKEKNATAVQYRQLLQRVTKLPDVSPSVAELPQEDIGLSGKSSAPPIFSDIFLAEMVSLKWSLQASVEHSRHRVFPVPVGLSSTPFTLYSDKNTEQRAMYVLL